MAVYSTWITQTASTSFSDFAACHVALECHKRGIGYDVQACLERHIFPTKQLCTGPVRGKAATSCCNYGSSSEPYLYGKGEYCGRLHIVASLLTVGKQKIFFF